MPPKKHSAKKATKSTVAEAMPQEELHESKQDLKSFLSSKQFLIPAIGTLVVILGMVAWFFRGQQEEIRTVEVTRGSIQRTSRVIGEIKPAKRIELGFEDSGMLKAIAVDIGDEVKQGDLLAELDSEDVRAAFQSAEASLREATARLSLEIAGETEQRINISKAKVEQAKADLLQARTDLSNTRLITTDDIKSAEIEVETAKTALENRTASLEQDVSHSYDELRIALLNALGPMSQALSDGDSIIGVDDTATNQSYENLLGIWNQATKQAAEQSYLLAKNIKERAELTIRSLNTFSSYAQVYSASIEAEQALTAIQVFIHDVQSVLEATITGVDLTETELQGLKSMISSDFTAISNELTTLLNKRQGTESAEFMKTEELDRLQYELDLANIMRDRAYTDADTKVKAAESRVLVLEASLQSALADLDEKVSPPREVDLAPLRAAVDNARAQLDRAAADLGAIQIRAPVDGIVSDILPEEGELVSAHAPVIRMIGDASVEIEAMIPEADIALLDIGHAATIELDAYPDNQFNGQIIAIEPDQTIIQDAVYYKTRISIEAEEQNLRPGMTADVLLLSEKIEDALIVPARVLEFDRELKIYTVTIKRPSGSIQKIPVSIELRGDAGMVALTGNLQEGDLVVIPE